MTIAIVAPEGLEPRAGEALKQVVLRVFGKEAVIISGAVVPDSSLDRDRGQYLASAVLNKVESEADYAGYERVIALVDVDLYAPNAGFVFGEASGKVAVVSTARMKESFYGLEDDEGLYLKRMLTEVIHELGHAYGLGHCYSAPCAMFFSNSIVDTDRKEPSLCRGCAKRIAAL